jgi:hypothetical protein
MGAAYSLMLKSRRGAFYSSSRRISKINCQSLLSQRLHLTQLLSILSLLERPIIAISFLLPLTL